VYNPEKCFNGYTLFPAAQHGAMLIDMNGKVVRHWKNLQGMPNKLLPGGQVLGHRGERDRIMSYQDKIDLVQVDWEGNVVWCFNKHEFIEGDDGVPPQWMARQHHDYQREGNPVGYYVPGMECKVENGNTLILAHVNVRKKRISPQLLIDDCIYEIDWEGNKVWEWKASDHFDEFGFSEIDKNALYRNPNTIPSGPEGQGDWLHINSMSVLGPNKWYDQGDERFHPDNIIIDSREASFLAIISKKTGKIVWRVGPDYTETKELKRLGAIIGVHHCHMIPQGLPGAGNILLFDNGGFSGYGLPGQMSKTGNKVNRRDYSRVLEFDPTTLEIIWRFTPDKLLGVTDVDVMHYFYSPLVSSAQRLPNGNTLITEGSTGRIIEVTKDYELVWEYISPYCEKNGICNWIYRAYRYPYDWIPQLQKPTEVPVIPPENYSFRLEGAAPANFEATMVLVEGAWEYKQPDASCVLSTDDMTQES